MDSPCSIRFKKSQKGTPVCEHPWGGNADYGQILVNIHVPKGTVVNVDSLQSAPQTADEDQE